MSPNTATLIDACFAVFAAVAFYSRNFILAVLFIQLFGIWSCVDGELARLSCKTSTLGDFYDTMVDRAGELIFVAGILFSFDEILSTPLWQPLLFAYIGAIFLSTNSSEKYRSAYQSNYPKRRIEPLFGWLCAGSDIRLLHLSIAIVWFVATGNPLILFWLIALMTLALYINFLFRLWKVFQIDQSISR
ncbi:MAG: CDP-alcohol phosphatidyltransferase family protein [Candidatus Neomarinimicrobiota bacterium]